MVFVQMLVGGQGVEDQWRGFVEDLGDHQWFVHVLASWLVGLWVAWDDDLVVVGLH